MRTAPSPGPLSLPLLPHHQASLSSLLFPVFSLPSSLPSPQTHKTRPPPLQNPTNFPVPPLFSPLRSTQKLQARRLLRTAPIFPSRVLLSYRRGAARRGGGEEPGRPPQRQVCTLMLSREKKERGTSRLRARRRRPLYRAALPRARATPASAPIPPPPPAAPHFPRAAPHSVSSSRAARRDTASRRCLQGSPTRSPYARPAPPSATPSAQVGKEVRTHVHTCAWRPREMYRVCRGLLKGRGRPAAHSDGILSRSGSFGPPRGGREATSKNIGAGVVGTTFCGLAGPPPAPLFVRLAAAEPGGAPCPRRQSPGPRAGDQPLPSRVSVLQEQRRILSPAMNPVFRVGNWFKHLCF